LGDAVDTICTLPPDQRDQLDVGDRDDGPVILILLRESETRREKTIYFLKIACCFSC
jgi:hypothetical protein